LFFAERLAFFFSQQAVPSPPLTQHLCLFRRRMLMSVARAIAIFAVQLLISL
jgi:hypothetical protein